MQKLYNYRTPFLNENFLVEGLEIDWIGKTVKINSSDKGIDFRDSINPQYYRYNGMDVISIFKRTKLGVDRFGKDVDGNPFIKAIKHKDGWKLNITKADIDYITSNFLSIVSKIKPQYDSIVMVPSHHKINNDFMEAIQSKLNCKYFVKDLFRKAYAEEAWDSIDWNEIKRYAREKHILYDEIVDELESGFSKMKTEWFEAKYVKKEYLRFIKTIVCLSNEISYEKCIEMFKDKHVLILDDTISTGQTVSNTSNIIKRMYGPKSVTIITLLSRLMK